MLTDLTFGQQTVQVTRVLSRELALSSWPWDSILGSPLGEAFIPWGQSP
jgi:hypothetical protein